MLVIGGTGGQGVPIVEGMSTKPRNISSFSALIHTADLVKHDYKVVVLTRDPNSDNSKHLAALKNVTFSIGAPDDEAALRKAFTGVSYAFVNLNTWALGMKNEIYWGIRIFEIAVQSGVKHYIWSSLDNFFHETNYDESLRVGHYYGKGHVEQWMSSLPQTSMKWSVICTGPYVEQLWSFQQPRKLDNGVYEFRLPLNDGAIPYTCLDDLGHYVRWIFENPERSAGLNLKQAVEHVSLQQLASTFTEATGKPAKSTNITIDEWFDVTGLTPTREHKISSTISSKDDTSLLTVYQNFSAWWRLYQRSGGNTGILRRDYGFLDEIHPQRTRSLKQWMQRVGYDGEKVKQFTVTRPWTL